MWAISRSKCAQGMNEPLMFLAPNRIPECGAYYDRRVIGFHLQLTDGPLELAYDDHSYSLSGECLWITEPGPRVRFKPIGRSTWFHRHVGFMGARVEQWRLAGLWPIEPTPAPTERAWAELFDELFHLTQRSDGWSRRRATNMIEGILMETAELSRVEPPSAPWLETVIHRLDVEGFSPDYTALAGEMGMSESALRRRFKRESGGLAIHEFVVLNRLGKAKTLLEGTDLSLSEVAERCGYSSEPFFARQFRAHAAMPPGEYRRLAASGAGAS